MRGKGREQGGELMGGSEDEERGTGNGEQGGSFGRSSYCTVTLQKHQV